jgi:hypothetical protein
MAKDPAFLFYPNDFLSGTQFFTDEQVGKYIRILMAQHQHGHLSEDQVIFICKSYDNHIFSKLKKDSAGMWYNERLEIEIKKRKNFILSRSKNKEGKTKQKIISKSHDSHMVNANENVIDNDLKINKESFEKTFEAAFDEIFLDQLRMKYGTLDLKKELSDFLFKCNAAPTEYHCRDRDGLRLGFMKQLKGEENKIFKNGNGINKKAEHTKNIEQSIREHYQSY